MGKKIMYGYFPCVLAFCARRIELRQVPFYRVLYCEQSFSASCIIPSAVKDFDTDAIPNTVSGVTGSFRSFSVSKPF